MDPKTAETSPAQKYNRLVVQGKAREFESSSFLSTEARVRTLVNFRSGKTPWQSSS